ncbi:MAG: peptide chain release factor 1 [Parcubacteria group bacterium CG_4_10_14_0_2_um_filter_7_35_8]|nr:MAG: peptide chain release factor 1 [Parcubacteria group bacterium CG_4_10_14_0_2_um_filter_7_35_8]
MDSNYQQIEQDYQKLIEELSDSGVVSDLERFDYLSKRKSQLELIMKNKIAVEEIERQINENESIISAKEDNELLSLVSEEQTLLRERKRKLRTGLEDLFKELDEFKKSSSKKTAAIIEIRAGVGGEEAALFAENLFQMYSGFARSQDWQTTVLDSSTTGIGGIKEIIFELKPSFKRRDNSDVFNLIRHEAGVHRVQRIPDTEKSGRVHTSTATIAVLMKPKEIEDLKIKQSDIKVDFFNASGPGGQNVNKRKTAVRVTHIPSGIIIVSRTERNQLQNKESALAILAAKILEQQKTSEETSVSGSRNAQIGQAKRSEKIRTYNFPQDRVTDHRIKKSWHHLEEILKGKLDPIINELQKGL